GACEPRGRRSFPTRRSSDLECCVAAVGWIGEGAYLNDLVRWPGSTIQPMDDTFQPANMMNKAEIQVPKRLLRDDALDWFERNDGDRKSTRLNSSHVETSYAV